MSLATPTASATSTGGAEADAVGRTGAPSARRYEYVPPSYLANLKKYRYSGSDLSIASRYVLQSYWNFLVSLVPMTVAPNMITFIGFVIGMSSPLILSYYYFYNGAEYPTWTLCYAALSLFTYQTMDAIDGKQARRTGAGSPLGELFDHGCDAFLTPFLQMSVVVTMRGGPAMQFWYLFCSSTALFGAMWEQYSTGTLELGYMSGPTEGILLCCAIFLVSAVCSTHVWDKTVVGPWTLRLPLTRLVPPSSLPLALHDDAWQLQLGSLRSLFFAFFVCSWLVTVSANVKNVLRRPSVRGSRLRSFVDALPTCLLAALQVALLLAYPTVHTRFPFALELSFGMLVTYTVTRMSIARLCAMQFRRLHTYYILSCITAVTALVARCVNLLPGGRRQTETAVGYALVCLTVLGVTMYGHMIVSVFRQMARYLHINIMSIEPRKKD